MAFNIFWACVIIGCIFASIAKASNISDVYPPLWKESPGQFSDYKIENGKYIINFWHYPERLGTYKILLNKTAKYFAKFSPENEQNILWGLPVHHGWQYHTDLNYYLSALPFLAAVDSGIMGISSDNVTFLPPSKDQMNFCYNVSSCHSSFPEAMKKWNEFYQHVKSHSSSFDELLEYLWAAHVSSLKVARKIFQNRLKYYSKQEADFERSWALFVDYLAPPNFPTTLIRTYEFQKELPTRMLVSGDRAPFISDFSGFQNTVLFALNLLHKVHKYTGSKVPLDQKTDIRYSWNILVPEPRALISMGCCNEGQVFTSACSEVAPQKRNVEILRFGTEREQLAHQPDVLYAHACNWEKEKPRLYIEGKAEGEVKEERR